MLKANQQALLQQTNIGLLNIRNMELNYYIFFYGSFSGQSALICGFVYSSVTQMGYGGGVPYTMPVGNQFAADDTPNQHGFRHYQKEYKVGLVIFSLFWITSAVCILAALHNIFCSTLILTLGPGKALFGPVGSMLPANQGMREEMKHVVLSYVVMVGSFAVSTAISFWVVMDLTAAILCTFIVVIAARYWYFYSERIYNRFYYDGVWDEVHMSSDRAFGDEATVGAEDLDDPMRQLDLEGIRRLELRAGAGSGAGGGSGRTAKVEGQGKDAIPLPSPSGGKNSAGMRMSPLWVSSSPAAPPPSAPSASPSSRLQPETQTGSLASRLIMRRADLTLKRNILMQGHMSKKAAAAAGRWGLQFSLDEWKRRYFVLHANGDLWYYKSFSAFQSAPDKRLKERAVELGLYDVRTAQTKSKDADDDNDDDNDSDTASVTSATTSPVQRGGIGGSSDSPSRTRPSLDIFLVPNEAAFKAMSMGHGSDGEWGGQPRVWHFQLDKEKEHQEWVAALTKVSVMSLT